MSAPQQPLRLSLREPGELLFGGDVSPEVRELVLEASRAPADERGPLFWTAQALAPEQLALYYLLYKHHAQRREFEQAERAARIGLVQAARAAGLPEDWRDVTAASAASFQGDGPARFWLFTLKALAFIHLRSGRAEEAREFLDKIERVDPQANIGGDVIQAMLSSTEAALQG
jgi:hypothetical protein